MEMNCESDPELFNLTNNGTKDFLDGLERFHKFYAPVHGFICVVICVFGLLTNLIHVIVLTRPSMRNSAVNSIMTAVAFCDMGTMGSYLIYIWNFVIRRYPNTCTNNLTYLWMVFLFAHIFLSIVLHTTSLWLAVAMAFMRRMTLRVASLNSPWQKSNYAYRISLGVFVVVFILTIPTWYVHEIIKTSYEWKAPEICSPTSSRDMSAVASVIYTINYNSIAKANGCSLFKANLWMTGIIFKVIPCFFLIVLSSSLMARLHNAEKKHQLLLVSNGTDSVKRIVSDRTTVMLLTILIVFLVTELPQGFLSIYIAIYTNDVYNYIYKNLGDVLDLLSLINSSVNFVLYCLMSSRYRHTFCAVMLPRSVARCIKNRQSANTTNYYSNSDYNPVRVRKISEFPLSKKNSCAEFRTQTTTHTTSRDMYYRSITPNLSESRRVI